jgi:hypothetical protein
MDQQLEMVRTPITMLVCGLCGKELYKLSPAPGTATALQYSQLTKWYHDDETPHKPCCDELVKVAHGSGVQGGTS